MSKPAATAAASAPIDERPRLRFVGDGRALGAAPHPDAPTRHEAYVAPAPLVDAVNLALFLRRPLLLEGEAGCGKTRLAYAVARELGLPLYTWHVRSTSRAQDGFYEYDALLRLHDAQTTTGSHRRSGPDTRDPGRPTQYRRLGPLGRAFQQRERPAVLLIDEIDKADVDFPNDLLTVLDRPWAFRIPETGELIQASEDCLPLVLITSNKEKGNLPAPFLRRCIYYFIEFPDDPERLKEIVAAHYAARDESENVPAPPAALVEAAAERFVALRTGGRLHKNPGTSEFLDWLEALRGFENAPVGPERVREAADEEDEDADADPTPLPFPNLLFKMRADLPRQPREGGRA